MFILRCNVAKPSVRSLPFNSDYQIVILWKRFFLTLLEMSMHYGLGLQYMIARNSENMQGLILELHVSAHPPSPFGEKIF